MGFELQTVLSKRITPRRKGKHMDRTRRRLFQWRISGKCLLRGKDIQRCHRTSISMDDIIGTAAGLTFDSSSTPFLVIKSIITST